jgi:hypothetical protein
MTGSTFTPRQVPSNLAAFDILVRIRGLRLPILDMHAEQRRADMAGGQDGPHHNTFGFEFR